MKKKNGMFDIALMKASMSMTSRQLADYGNRRHDHVLRDIRIIFKNAKINAPKYEEVYFDKKGEKRIQYKLPKDETLLIVSKWSDSLRWKIIQRMNNLEEELIRQIQWNSTRDSAKISSEEMRKELRENHIREYGFEPTYMDYALEYNTIYKLVIGMTAKQYKEKHKIEIIRDHLTNFENDLIDSLQIMLDSLMKADLNVQQRSNAIERHYNRIMRDKLKMLK